MHLADVVRLRPERPIGVSPSLPFARKPFWVFAASLLLLGAVAFLDYAVLDASLGVMYIIPVLTASIVLNRWQVLFFAVCCAALRHLFLDAHTPLEGFLRFLLALTAYSAGGLLVLEMVRNRNRAEAHAAELGTQQQLRREIEDHLRLLAESSPAAIFTTDEDGRLLSHNKATLAMMGVALPGELATVTDCLPVLRDALKLQTRASGFRTAAQCTGRRLNGDPFIAQLWFSIYEGSAGRRLAAIAVDSSEEVREREEQNLRQILDNNRIIAGAVSHEIRNVCGAISLVYSNLRRQVPQEWIESEDFHALGSLVEGLGDIAAADLQIRVKRTLTPICLRDVLADLRVVIEPGWQEAEGRVQWSVPEELPLAFAEPFGLTQAILNLSQNSLRAVERSTKKELLIQAEVRGRQVALILEDSGPGIGDPQRLFEPFQRGAEHVGLGLYVSRAILRSYGGDLRHEATSQGCRFVAYLQASTHV